MTSKKSHKTLTSSQGSPKRGVVAAIRHRLESEVFSGSLMIGAALLALLWANSPWRAAYAHLSHLSVGPHFLHLDMSLAHWASDGVLAIFFLAVGLELKHELVLGSLRDKREAALPMLAAVFGIIGPAAVYVLFQFLDGGQMAGWAIPTATDIAFALTVLALFGRGFPPAARTFLLTLAVVDDLLAIIIIALFYSGGIHVLPLLGAFAAVAVFAVLVRQRWGHWFLLIPVGVAAWLLMHVSGIHATIAGVLLGLVVPAQRTVAEPSGMAHRFTHVVHPWSAGLALPIFAFFASGVTVIDGDGFGAWFSNPVSLGIALALPIGKMIGIWGSVAVLTSVTPLRLGHGVDLPDIRAVSAVAGIGFTVSLLIAGLAFPEGEVATQARSAVLMGTAISAVVGTVLLRLRLHTARRGAPADEHHTHRPLRAGKKKAKKPSHLKSSKPRKPQN